jgi:hypothetical protein
MRSTALPALVGNGVGPKAMEVIGKYHNGIDPKRALIPHGTEGFAQDIDVFGQQAAVAFQQRHREEIRTAGDISTNIVGHGASWPHWQAARKAGYASTLTRPTALGISF